MVPLARGQSYAHGSLAAQGTPSTRNLAVTAATLSLKPGGNLRLSWQSPALFSYPLSSGKGMLFSALYPNPSLTCSFSCLSERLPQHSFASSQSCSWLLSSSRGQRWGAPEQCPAVPRPRWEVPWLCHGTQDICL